MAEIARRTERSVTRQSVSSPAFIRDTVKVIADEIIKFTHELEAPLLKGIVTGAANVPLSLASLSHYNDLLHGGAYKAAAKDLPYYNPGVQAQIQWQQNPIIGFLIAGSGPTYVDITPEYTIAFLPLGPPIVNVSHPHPTWIGLPPGAKPEQLEAIIDSGQPHVLPKLMSDQEYYLSKEWTSLFFDLSLAGSAFTNFSTNIRTLAQAADEVLPLSGGGQKAALTGKAAEELG